MFKLNGIQAYQTWICIAYDRKRTNTPRSGQDTIQLEMKSCIGRHKLEYASLPWVHILRLPVVLWYMSRAFHFQFLLWRTFSYSHCSISAPRISSIAELFNPSLVKTSIHNIQLWISIVCVQTEISVCCHSQLAFSYPAWPNHLHSLPAATGL